MLERNQAIAILKAHNDWRQGGKGEMQNPHLITEAIDLIIYQENDFLSMVKLSPQFDKSLRNFVDYAIRSHSSLLKNSPIPELQKQSLCKGLSLNYEKLME